MPTCSNCGATVRENARFCTSCGTRLNEPAEPTSSDWSSTSQAPAADTSSPVETSVWESIRQEVTAESGDTNPDSAARASDDTEPAAGAEVEQEVVTENETADEEAFTWSWNTPAAADDNSDATSSDDVAPPVDDESSVLLDTGEPNKQEDEATDLTEIDILDDSPEVSDVVAGENGIATSESASDEPAPDTAEVDDLLDAPAGDTETQETLAAWATQWNTPVDSATTVDDEQAGDGDIAPEADAVAPETTAPAFDPYASAAGSDDDEEDTVAKAERLIGELRAIIPALAQPKPAQPALSRDPAELASDLDNAAKLGAWDDLRQVLLNARDNPRDIDNLVKLGGNVDQMLELLDDRNNLAKTATNVAALLRQPADRAGEL